MTHAYTEGLLDMAEGVESVVDTFAVLDRVRLLQS